MKEVFFDDAAALFRGHPAIPDALWIDEHPWSIAADSETCGLGSHDGNSELFDAILQTLPCLKTVAFGAAIRPYAEKNMPLRGFDAHFGKTGIGWIHLPESKLGLRQEVRRMETLA